MQAIRALVTGAGSGVGQGIIKALRLSSLPITVIASDIAPLRAGLFRADEAILLPKVEDNGALAEIVDKINHHKIQVVFIGSEFDLLFFSENKSQIEQSTSAIVVVSSPETVEISDDKVKTTEFLKSKGFPHAECFTPNNLEEAIATFRGGQTPLVLKPRRGTSSRHVHFIHSESDLREHFETTPAPMLQRLIMDPSDELTSEYTCSVFKCRDGSILGPFTAKRTLRWGTSWTVEVDQFLELHPILMQIAESLPIVGPFNVQLGVGEQGPIPFEFNARFSGTTAIRAHYGFNEPDFALRDMLLEQEIPAIKIGRGVALRYLEEVFVENVSAEELNLPLPRGTVNSWF